MDEKRKEYSRKYYQKNKEKMIKNQKEKYQKNKEEKLAYQKEYYQKNKEEVRAYQKAYNNFSEKKCTRDKFLNLRKIEVTEEELEWMKHASCLYIKGVNKLRPSDKLNDLDVMGEAYEGLLVAISNFDPKKVKNISRKNFIISKIRYHLIDSYRNEFGRVGKQKIGRLNCISADYKIEGEDMYVRDLIEDHINIDNHIENLDSNYLLSIIREEFLKNESPFYKHSEEDLFQMWHLRFCKSKIMKEIAKEFDISESRVSQMFTGYINPLFEEIKTNIRSYNPSSY